MRWVFLVAVAWPVLSGLVEVALDAVVRARNALRQ